jgi:hypothetical protein
MMRKLLLLGALAALGTMLIATPASASFDSHFSVRGHHFKLHAAGHHRLRFEVVLKKHGSRVGRAHGRCHDISSSQAKCHIHYHLNGKVGGRGDINARGRFGKGRERFDVTGGTGDFNGVAGKVILNDQNKSHFHLVA